LTPGQSQSSDRPATFALEEDDPGQARERTALAWTRSALNMAASGALIARAAFVEHLVVLGVTTAIGMAALSALTWRHGQVIYRARHHPGLPPHIQTSAFELLMAATLLTAAIAVIVTIVF
jgi:uncharacterized membrane protein YidH (DUF202 family)